MSRTSRKALAIFFIFLAVLFAVGFKSGFLPLSEIGYISGTQGLEMQFHSLYFNRTWCSAAERPSWAGKASSWSFGYSLVFDPDIADDGWCDLCASQQAATVDRDTEPKYYGWTVDQGVVTLPNGTKARKVIQFEMWRFRLTWRMNLWLSGTEGETGDWTYFNIITWTPDYAGTVLWIKIVPRTFVYFKENPEQLFIAPCYIALNSITFAMYDKDKREIVNDPDAITHVDLIPKAVGEATGIYYQRGGTPVNIEDAIFSYKGATLDPSIFRSEYWTRVDLLTFKPKHWFDYQIWHNWKFPSVHMEFLVYVFVVGKWTVYLASDEVPRLQPHTPVMVTGNPIADFFRAIGDWLSNPWTQLWLFFLIVVAVVIIITIFSPGVWTALAMRRS